MILIPKWKKDATSFTVGVNFNEVRGAQTSIPKPVMEKLGNPKKITFILTGKRVEIRAATDDENSGELA